MLLYEVHKLLTVSPLYTRGTNSLDRKPQANKGGTNSEVLLMTYSQPLSKCWLLDLDVVIKEAFRYTEIMKNIQKSGLN